MYNPSDRRRQPSVDTPLAPGTGAQRDLGDRLGLWLTLLLVIALLGTGCDQINALVEGAKGKEATKATNDKSKDGDKKPEKVDCEQECPCDCKCPEADATPPNKEPYPMVFAGNVKVAEGPLKDEVAGLKVNNQRYSLRECYAPALKKDPNLKGEMDVQFTVSGGTGKVIAAIVRQSTINDKEIESCVKNKAMDWTFPVDAKKKRPKESVVKFTVVMMAVSL